MRRRTDKLNDSFSSSVNNVVGFEKDLENKQKFHAWIFFTNPFILLSTLFASWYIIFIGQYLRHELSLPPTPPHDISIRPDEKNHMASSHNDKITKSTRPKYTNRTLSLLWKGDTPYGSPNDFRRIHLVISHCDEDLQWINDMLLSTTLPDMVISSITIYSKCQKTISHPPPTAKIVSLPNIGRCDHSYAHYITHISSDVSNEDAVVFMKGSRYIHQAGEWRSLEDLLRIASVNGFACGMEPLRIEHNLLGSLSAYHNTAALIRWRSYKYEEKERDRVVEGAVEFKSSFRNLGSWLKSIGGWDYVPKPFVNVCYGGVFAVRVERMRRLGGEFWERLERSLERGDNIEESHFAERSWAGLLSKPLDEEATLAIMNYRTGMRAWNPVYKGILVRQHEG